MLPIWHDLTHHHLCCAVELHGTGAKRYHGVHQRDVFVLQHLHVTNNVCLRLKPVMIKYLDLNNG